MTPSREMEEIHRARKVWRKSREGKESMEKGQRASMFFLRLSLSPNIHIKIGKDFLDRNQRALALD